MDESRKGENLRRNPRIALVIGGTAAGERTVQYEGLADEPTGAELERLRELYFESFPDGRERQSWPGITYIRARLTWIRYSDFSPDPPAIIEFERAELGARLTQRTHPACETLRGRSKRCAARSRAGLRR